MRAPEHPTWDDDIAALFAAPTWIEESRRQEVAGMWAGCMSGYYVYLDQYESVCEWSVTIYNHLASRNMPLTDDHTQLWPEAALEILRRWINEGCRRDAAAPIERKDVIPAPRPEPARVRVRKDINHLTAAELDEYRMKLEDFGVTSSAPDSPHQKIGYIHTNWCLHYKEAFLLWHRANMLYLEELIDFPIPYWNWMSPRVAVDGDPAAGLPQAFKDETYVHPRTGEIRPNPLRYAAAKDGKSKLCAGDHPAGVECRYVQRDPVLYTRGDDQRAARQEKLNQLITYQDQVRQALTWPIFSSPQGSPAYPWANIQTFPAPDSAYPHKCDFDGLYEQPHDNYHGWVGPDMADNAYTAFDPVFWSHHAMIDCVFEAWLRANPAAMFTASFPLQPFVGPRADKIDEADPRPWVYTTIGDMARDSRALGFDFAPPEGLDMVRRPNDPWEDHLYILFEGVRCTLDTYAVDVFIEEPNPTPADATSSNPHYVLRMMRLGMGVVDDKGRCIVTGVTRVVAASRNAHALGLKRDTPVAVSLIVTDVTRGRVLPPEEYQKLPGFSPTAMWGQRVPIAPGTIGGGHGCCQCE